MFGFHLKAFKFTMIFCSLLTTKFYTFVLYINHASSPRPPLPPLFSLTIPKKQQVIKKFSIATHTMHKPSTCSLAYPQALNKHCSLHSLPHTIKDSSYLPCSAPIKFQSRTYTLTCHTNPALLMHSIASAYKTNHICKHATTLHPPTT